MDVKPVRIGDRVQAGDAMKHLAIIFGIAFLSVAISAITGNSDESGLFGAIIAVGWYAANVKGGAA